MCSPLPASSKAVVSEADFIRALQHIAADPAARGLADDCAVIGDLVLTHDMMVAGTHFLPDAPPEDLAWKLVGVNLSDLAAKGAVPVGVLLGYMLGDEQWDARFAAALGDALRHHDVALLGGDTVAAPAGSGTAVRSFGMTAIGRASHLPVPARSGAQPGDALWITGSIGDAMLGHLSMIGALPVPLAPDHPALLRLHRPTPRLAEGRALAPAVTAMMDVSDGLLLDATRMAEASGVTIAIDSRAVPVCPALLTAGAAANNPAWRDDAMAWGDDYELLFALPAGMTPAVAATRIGGISLRGDHAVLIDGNAPAPARRLGWLHENPV